MDQYLAIYTPVAELANRIDLANKNLITLNPSTELNGFKQMLQGIDIPTIEINNLALEGILGNYRLVSNGQALDIVRGVEDLRYNANLLNFLKRLGLTTTSTAQTKENEIKTQYVNVVGFHQIMRMKHRIKIAKVIAGRYGKSPRNEQELEAVLNKDPNLKASFDSFLQKLRGSYVVNPNDKPYGDWVRIGCEAKTYDLTTLFKAINNHKSSLGGCWAVKTDGYKCLIPSLTCTPIKGQQCNPDNRCGTDKKQPCYTCLKWNGNRCTRRIKPSLCASNEVCSKACSNRQIEVPNDTVLICIKRKFWIAAQDYMNTFSMAPGPPPPVPVVVPDDTDEPDDEDADDVPDEDEDEETSSGSFSSVADFFGSTWIIWLIGLGIIGIIIFKNKNR
ncbi:hypothetical protein [carnivorous sponge associated iridovirus]|nr:hypothetical protein [carnivorous sponge associated iridovirus]